MASDIFGPFAPLVQGAVIGEQIRQTRQAQELRAGELEASRQLRQVQFDQAKANRVNALVTMSLNGIKQGIISAKDVTEMLNRQPDVVEYFGGSLSFNEPLKIFKTPRGGVYQQIVNEDGSVDVVTIKDDPPPAFTGNVGALAFAYTQGGMEPAEALRQAQEDLAEASARGRAEGTPEVARTQFQGLKLAEKARLLAEGVDPKEAEAKAAEVAANKVQKWKLQLRQAPTFAQTKEGSSQTVRARNIQMLMEIYGIDEKEAADIEYRRGFNIDRVMGQAAKEVYTNIYMTDDIRDQRLGALRGDLESKQKERYGTNAPPAAAGQAGTRDIKNLVEYLTGATSQSDAVARIKAARDAKWTEDEIDAAISKVQAK